MCRVQVAPATLGTTHQQARVQTKAAVDPSARLSLEPDHERHPVRVEEHVKDRLIAVQEKVARLLGDRAVMRDRSALLEAELNDHRRTVEVLKARVTELERENGVLRKARAAENGTGAAGTKERIDELVHEIDRCLALLTPEPAR
jgi:chromosome segregation ATPase